MKKLFFIFCCTISISSLSFPQSILTGDATRRVDSLIKIMPATSFTNEYHPLNYTQEITWAQVVNQILDGNISGANNTAAGIGYKVVILSDIVSQKTYYFLEKHPDSLNYWGTLVFNPNPLRSKLVIQVPHPLADTLTGPQGFQIFKTTGAFLFCISGTHRCNSSDSTTCTGKTDVCGLIHASYRKSDQSHSTESMFQVTTEVLLNNNPQMIFIQPHGFTKERGDPDFVLSNGTRFAPTSTDYISALKDTMLKAVPFLKFKVIHTDTGWANLAATTNTQGRLINGSSSPCYLNASYATGRFIHIEQAPYVRYPQVWYLLNNALLKVIPADPYTSVVSYFNAEQERKNILIQWETSEEKGNYGFELQKRMNNDEEWTFTTFISAYHNPGTYRYYDDPKGGDTVYYRLKQINTDGSSRLLPPVSVNLLPSEEPVLYDNYPNPFNASTIISFEIPQTGEAELSVFNILGEKIKTLAEGTLQGGYHKITFNAGDMPAGVYFYRLVTRGFAQTKKLTLLK